MSTILVVGATGLLGTEICRQLTAAGRSVRALVRSTSDPAKVERLRSFGAEIIEGDLRNPASLDEACRGVTAVIVTASSMPLCFQAGVNDTQTTDLNGVSSLIDSARRSGVSRFVHTTFSKNFNLSNPLGEAKREVERRLMESGMTYTILRPSCFMEVWLSPVVGFDPANAKATIYGTGQNPLSWISLRDVAQFAVASLDHPAAENAILEMGGPEPIAPLHVVELFEKAGGRPFELQFVPEAALQAQYETATDPFHKIFASLMWNVAMGDPIDMSALSATFGLQLISVEEYASQTMLRPEQAAASPAD